MALFRFQTKLFLAISVVVAGALLAVHVVTQRKVREVYGRLFEERFSAQIDSFLEVQESRLESAADWCAAAANSRLAAEMLAGQPKRLVVERFKKEIGEREFRLGGGGVRPGPGGGGNLSLKMRPSMVALMNLEGEVIPISGGVVGKSRAGGKERAEKVAAAIGSGEITGKEIGYMAVGEDEDLNLVEVVAAPIQDADSGEVLGALIVGLPPSGVADRLLKRMGSGDEGERILGGRYLDGMLFSDSIPAAEKEAIAGMVSDRFSAGEAEGIFDIESGGWPYRVQFRALNPGSSLPVAYNVALYPLAELHGELGALRGKAIWFGLGALGLAFLAAFWLARRISVPIGDLSAGTEKVREGDYSARVKVRSKDEIGVLAESFNEMAAGLAQREKIRGILGKVVDEEVARELVDGVLDLGGEEREASVLFCDIRGFTAMTETMAPKDVIGLVNGHMTAMTEVVHRHHGVVDKFVGDLVMAVFGVPKKYGDDAGNAVRCALEMVKERRRLNAEGGIPIEVGIGVATGVVLAGRMGSESRLDFTVLGERVNLASRLCGVAGEGEVVLDAETKEKSWEGVEVEEMGEVELKGFREGVAVFRALGAGDGFRRFAPEMVDRIRSVAEKAEGK